MARKKKRKKAPTYEENMAKLAKRGPRDSFASGVRGVRLVLVDGW
jgi:hypothetical protein